MTEAERLAQELDHAWLLGPPTIEQRKQISALLRSQAAEIEALRADAERYRAIREFGSRMKLYVYDDPADPCSGDWLYKPTPEQVDAEADAAIEAARQSNGA